MNRTSTILFHCHLLLCDLLLVDSSFPITCVAGTTLLSYFLLYIVAKHMHNIDDDMETNNRKDHLNRLKLRSDSRNNPYDRNDYRKSRV